MQITVTDKVHDTLRNFRVFITGRWTFTTIHVWKGSKCRECGMPINPGDSAYRIVGSDGKNNSEIIHPSCLGLFFKNRRR